MTKKNFKAIAEQINKELVNSNKNYKINNFIMELCRIFKEENPQFNDKKFKEFCFK